MPQEEDFVEVKPLISKQNFNLFHLRDLFEAVLTVAKLPNLDEVLKMSPFSAISAKNLPNLRNEFTKELMGNGGNPPQLPEKKSKVKFVFEYIFLISRN